MKQSCVIFACTILSDDRLFVLQNFLDEFKKDFSDCDIYVGINPNSTQAVEDLINNSNLNIKGLARVSESLYTLSDASAYQLALKLVKQSNTDYDTYWFIHTKSGVNSHSDYLREWYINSFLSDRSNVETFLHKHTGIGSYGMLGIAYNKHNNYQEQDTEIPLFQNTLTDALPYTHANFFYIHTLYAVKRIVVKKFLELITDVWFNSKLDRYYFEGVFPFVVSRLGYYPYLSNGIDMNGQSISELNSSWLNENNLVSYKEYLHLHKTNYTFDQLSPPYT